MRGLPPRSVLRSLAAVAILSHGLFMACGYGSCGGAR